MGKNKILIKEMNRISMLPIDEITHITCNGYLSTIHTACEKFINVSKLLKEFESELTGSSFVRVNHSTLVNYDYVNTIEFGNIRTLTLCNNIKIKISRRKMKNIAEFLKK
jgi:two-component system LytT family response regulator